MKFEYNQLKRRGAYDTIEEMLANPSRINIVADTYEIRITEVGIFCAKIKKAQNPREVNLEPLKEGLCLTLPKKIPFSIYQQILSFFRSYCDKLGNKHQDKEVCCYVLWDTFTEDYVVHVPEQKVHRVTVHYELEIDNERYIPVLKVHSHNNLAFGAQFSSWDDRDDIQTMVHAVVGHISKAIHDITVRISSGGNFAEIHPTEIFEDTMGYFKLTCLDCDVYFNVDYPSEWHDNVKIIGGFDHIENEDDIPLEEEESTC